MAWMTCSRRVDLLATSRAWLFPAAEASDGEDALGIRARDMWHDRCFLLLSPASLDSATRSRAHLAPRRHRHTCFAYLRKPDHHPSISSCDTSRFVDAPDRPAGTFGYENSSSNNMADARASARRPVGDRRSMHDR